MSIKNSAIYIGQTNQSMNKSIHSYAQSCQLYSIFGEITKIVARKNNMNTNQALSQYLSQCNKGEHVVLKSYISFSKSMINRQCFLYNFCKIFEMETNSRNGIDYYQLFRLLCSDFPKQVIVNAVRIIQGDHEKMMETLLNSQKYLNALYITFIYSQYIENLLHKVFQSKFEQQVPLLDVFSWLQAQNQRNPHCLEKPPIQNLYQIILNYLSTKGSIKIKGISFLNQYNISDFILNCCGGQYKSSTLISFNKLLQLLLNNKKHQKHVQNNLFCFDNSSNWANEAVKIINLKEDNPQPLNSKKMKKK